MTRFRAMQALLQLVAKLDRGTISEELLDYMAEAMECRAEMVRAFFDLPEELQKMTAVERSDGKPNLWTLMWANHDALKE